MEQAGQWPSCVAIDTHTLIGLGRGVDIINRLSEIQGVITNRIGANINERINNTFDGASWSVAELCGK